MPRGYDLEWGGTFENLRSATARLSIVVPIALGLIFLLLYATFGSVRPPSTLIFLSVPLGAIGGVLSLWLRGLNFSISAGVGFIALSGVAVWTASSWSRRSATSSSAATPSASAVAQAGLSRLRPVLMTACVASLGFIPMALSHSAGAEVQRLATVVIGGLLTSTLLNLVVVPAVYPWFDPGPDLEAVAPKSEDPATVK